MMPTRQTNSDIGVKHDAGKLRIDLITPEMINSLAKVLGYGAHKYGERNFELGLEFNRLWGAAQRHLWSYWQGEDIDKESGLPHLWHAFTTIGMLITLSERGFPNNRPNKICGGANGE